MRKITRFYKQLSKQKIKENKKIELDTRAGLKLATTILHNNINNFDKQWEDNQLRRTMEEIETKTKTKKGKNVEEILLGLGVDGKKLEINASQSS